MMKPEQESHPDRRQYLRGGPENQRAAVLLLEAVKSIELHSKGRKAR